MKIFSSVHNDATNGKKDLNEAAATDYRVVSHWARAAGVTPQEPLTSGQKGRSFARETKGKRESDAPRNNAALQYLAARQ